MRIDSSQITMGSTRKYASVRAERYSSSYSVLFAGGKRLSNKNFSETLDTKEEEESDQSGTTLNNSTEDLQNRYKSMSSKVNRISSREQTTSLNTIRQQCVKFLFQLLFENRRKSIFGDSEEGQSFEDWYSNMTGGGQASIYAYSAETYYEETESTSFSTTGTVVTADGREISFGVELEMSRSFAAYYQENFYMEQNTMCDPLVINLDGNIADVSDQKFTFDLDTDGVLDSISMLQKGSGFLALDKNGDGSINDGSELFGTASGNGFADLEEYDSDGNGWIDENDPIFEKLLVWAKNDTGEDTLYTLKESGVGAICLQRVNTNFSMKSINNTTNGAIRQTGIFLYENGMSGTVQHVDLAKG
ncbi:MAG: hypothetical protein PHP50_02100 [Lachnospiraceae bacterium]|nr:hypothetical protein [Lachnospiraceae bacterium]